MKFFSRLRDALMKQSGEDATKAPNADDVVTQQIDGFDTSIRSHVCDDEVHFEISVVNSTEPTVQTVCRIVEGASGVREIFPAFAVDGFDVAAPEDIPEQEAANAILEKLLREADNLDAGLITSLNDRWSSSKSRLEARWKEIAEEGPTIDTLSIVHRYSRASLGLATRTTKLGTDELFIVYKDGKGFRKAYSHRGKISEKVSAPTQELLSKVQDFSGHEKLELLSGGKPREYEAAWAEFDKYRRAGLSRNKLVALRTSDAIAKKNYGIEFNCINGDEGSIYVRSVEEKGSPFTARLRLVREKYDIDIEIEAEKSSIERSSVHEKRFKSPDLLNEAVRRVLKMILVLDQPVHSEAIPKDLGVFSPTHPLLEGWDVPPRHQPLIGAILGEPYEKALKASERFAARSVKKAEKAESVVDLPKSLPDGTVLGRVDGKTCENYASKTKLALVRTISPQGARLKRQLQPLQGFGTPRPMTAKQVARFALLKTSDALQRAHDMHLMGIQRDVIEAAFRLSFELGPGARNPLLDADPWISVVASELEGFNLRVTQVRSVPGVQLLAIALSQHDLDHDYVPVLATGCGFMVLKIGDTEGFHLRPAIMNNSASLPKAHRAALGAGVTQQFSQKPKEVEVLRRELDAAWSKLAKRYPEA